MKRTLTLSLLLAALLAPLQAAEWNASTTGDQVIAEDIQVTETANVGNITFNGDSVVSGSGSIGGSGHLTVNSGTVVFDGVSRSSSTGHITVAAGATLEITKGARLLTGSHNTSSVVTVNGTLKVEHLNYGGSLGSLQDNVGVQGYSDALVLNGGETAASGPRVEITESGSATIGARLNGWGRFFTFAVADGKEFDWRKSGNGNVIAYDGAGSVLVLEAGEDATFTLGKNIGTGLSINKTGMGTLVLNGGIHLDSGRSLSINEGTVKFGASANITSVGNGFYVQSGATLDLDGQGGQAGLTVSVNGFVENGQNNAMRIDLGEGGLFSISDDASDGYTGTVVLSQGAEVDLAGYVFYNTIDISNGGSLINGQNHRGTVVLGTDEDGVTCLDSDTLTTYASSLASAGSMEVSLSVNLISEAPDATLLKGRLYADYGLSIEGTGEENISISGYSSEYGALSAQDGDLSITGVNDVYLGYNAADSEREDDYNRGGALSATGSVTLEAAGAVVVEGNSADVNYTSAGAIYAGGDVSLTGTEIILADNATGSDLSAGAIKAEYGTIYLTATEGNVEITGNSAGDSGGALYAVWGVEISAAGDIEFSGNTAEYGDGGAVYSNGDVVLTPGEGASVFLAGNSAGNNGGAVYSDGTVYLSGGNIVVRDNAACGYGGAINAYSVEIAADAGDVTFSGNTHDGGTANDVELQGGAANLSASNGHVLEMQGGITCAGEINISTDEVSVVKLGGYSSTETFSVTNGRVVGLTDDEGNPASVSISSAMTLDAAYVKNINFVDEYGEAVLTSSASTYVYADASTMVADQVDDAVVSLTSSSVLVNGFACMEGELTIALTGNFLASALAAAEGAAVNIALDLVLDSTLIGESGFAFYLDADTQALLDASCAEAYGFYDAEGNLLDCSMVWLMDSATVTFAVNMLTNIVPEPATTTLSLLALSALCLRRRRQN